MNYKKVEINTPENIEKEKLKILDSFKEFKEDSQDNIPYNELKYMFLSSVIFDVVTYDGDMDLLIGKEIYEVMKVIFEGKNFDYISNDENYNKYFHIINLRSFKDLLEWGTSIRGAWFDYYGAYQSNGNFLNLRSYGFYEIKLSEEFMRWFLYDFLAD